MDGRINGYVEYQTSKDHLHLFTTKLHVTPAHRAPTVVVVNQAGVMKEFAVAASIRSVGMEISDKGNRINGCLDLVSVSGITDGSCSDQG